MDGAGALSRLTAGRVEWPFWNDAPASDTVPGPGLWSVEPHLEVDGLGVKSEEVLVVDPDGSARWLEPEPWSASDPGPEP